MTQMQSLKSHRFLHSSRADAASRHAAVSQVDPNGPVEVVIPDHGAYTGAFMDFGDAEDDVTLETIEDFEEMVGKHQAIIVSSSYWGEQNFPTDNLNVIWRHGSLPLVFWSPWDKPYEEDHGPDKFGLTEILAGNGMHTSTSGLTQPGILATQ